MGTLLQKSSTIVWCSSAILSALLALGQASPLATQPTVPDGSGERLPDIKTLRAGFRKSLLSVVIPERKTYKDELLALEQKHAAAQDFAGALKAREARVLVEREISALEQEAAILAARPSVENAARLAARIELKLADASLSGVQIDASDGALTGWGDPKASASWKLPDLPPGGYEVLLRCTGEAGEVLVKESLFTLSYPCKAVTDHAVEQNLGTLRIKDGSGPFVLSVSPPEKCAGWRVYAIILIPAAI